MKNYLIRLLPQVGREIAHLDLDEGCEVVESIVAQAIACVTMSSYCVDCDAEADAAKAQ